MYESFFGFVKRPFLAVSTLDRYFPATSIEQSFQSTSRAIQRGEGPVAVFGGTGLGKTMYCLRMAENFRRNFEVVMLASSQLITRRALLQSLLFELRMPYRDMSEGELRLTLMNRLQPSTDNPTDGLVLIVDEAQTLSMKLLEELRLMTNVVRNGVPRVRLVLCGTMRLEECLAHPQMDSLCQRLASRCYLTPLSIQETAQYVTHKIEISGVASSSVMTRDALDAIYRGSDGIPRLIDQLADHALMMACQERERPVSAAMIGRAWCMLQQLPNPWSQPESIAKSGQNESHPNANIVEPESTETTNYRPTTPLLPPRAVLPTTIEFGELNDDEPESNTPPKTNAIFSAFNTSEVEADAPPREPIPTEEVDLNQRPAKRNVLDVFSGDFDEEFSIPVQSSGNYQEYSGAAYGNLNHDLTHFDLSSTSHGLIQQQDFEEALDFFDGALEIKRNILSDSFNALDERTEIEVARTEMEGVDAGGIVFDNGVVEESIADPISNISSEQAANLERQIEDEMRDLVSGLNMSAMTFDPSTSIETFANPSAFSFDSINDQNLANEHRSAHQAHSNVISFAGLRSNPESAEFSRSNSDQFSQRAAMSDDRDLLVIENELESIRGGTQHATTTTGKAVMHPYAKLFTKLRNS